MELKLVSPTSVSHDTYNNKYTITDVKAGVSMVPRTKAKLSISNYTKAAKRTIHAFVARTTPWI